jgi:hypothetical protein
MNIFYQIIQSIQNDVIFAFHKIIFENYNHNTFLYIQITKSSKKFLKNRNKIKESHLNIIIF